MRVVAQNRLQAYWERRPETEAALRLWLAVARRARWATMSEAKARFSKSKALNGERIRYEINGGDYRLVVAIQFKAQIIWIKFIGSHAEYDRIDALNVEQF